MLAMVAVSAEELPTSDLVMGILDPNTQAMRWGSVSESEARPVGHSIGQGMRST